ncbi:PLP-dependent aminotransferase family protein [Pseudalkalibacillus caeni]|uniref:PLP-dependent aminotransferase family protein n=1 Tax=Exobacillus caeni TaxID=2574798 RepID=A0A5R9FCP9_9BACL|nr:PLP-dependent aminotransferase family protein [Pseudalkalibacillus caeni]TLS38653.1 PLP-dependent aminotransferase family protein [Pseudalkalibacillus caeni]
MIYVKIDKQSNQNYIYQQIYEGIKVNILEGRMKPDEKLPSKRNLADQLNVSVNSVMNAYEQLLAEGYIYTSERKGYYVESITRFLHNENSIKKPLPQDLKEKSKNHEGWLSLSHMTADISLFPFKEWLKCQQKALSLHKRELSEIPNPQGPYIVRRTICRLIALTRGVICEPEQVVLGSGTMSLIQQLMVTQNNNAVVALEDPGYFRLYSLLKKMGFNVNPVGLDDRGIKIEEVDSLTADFTFVTPSHQFPTGKIMPISRRIELLNWAASSGDRYIVEDDYDSEFKYKTDSIPALQSLDRNQRVIYTGSFSKTMLPGLRISYMVLPPDLLREFRRYHTDLIQSSNSLNLFTLHYFIENGEYSRHVKRMNHLYETKRKMLIKELQDRFKSNVEIDDIPAGLHLLAHFKTTKSYEEIETRAKEQKLEIYTMKRFLLEKEYESNNKIDLIIGFANIQEEKIAEAVDRLFSVLGT